MEQLNALFETPHRRLNPLTGEWVIVSPQRMARPWQGQVEPAAPDERPSYDPQCYLCPGNQRAEGVRNPAYESTFVFDNDFPALLPSVAPGAIDQSGLLVAESEPGLCRVLCFSPRHDLSLAGMQLPDLVRVVDLWAQQYDELAALPWVGHVQIFENRGPQMGASNPHPHGQIWAEARLPNEPGKELRQQRAYLQQHGQCLLCAYLSLELASGERVIYQNEHAVVLTPFWAVWPFETLLLPRAHHAALPELDAERRLGLAEALQRLTRAYDRIFSTSFPYSMGWHQRPTDGAAYPEWHLHGHFYPPLLRSASVRKFMVGYELLAQPQRDLTPERAAERLREMIEK